MTGVQTCALPICGNLIIGGNLTILGKILNASVEQQYLNGSFIPSLNDIFNLGSSDYYWNNLYLNSILAKDWSNVTITESQISDLSPHRKGDDIYLYNNTSTIFLNESKLNETIGKRIIYSNASCDNPDVVCIQKENTFLVDQYITEGYRFNFRNMSNNTYFFYNLTNGTLQLFVNGLLQQDWGHSTTIYGKATFLADAFFQNISGNSMIIDTNVLITGNLTVQDYYKGNGSQLTDVCHSDGTGCGSGQIDTQKAGASPYLYNDTTFIYFNETYLNGSITLIVNASTINWSNIANSPTDISYFNNDVGYITEANDSDTHVAGDDNYLTNDSTIMYFNESKLNDTVQTLVGLQTEYVNITVTGGIGTGVTIDCCTPQGEIIQVAVFPTTTTNKYRFSANGTISGETVDADRKKHKGDWIVGHDGVTLVNETISLYLTHVNADELFIVRVRWRP